ncbi:GNAT family N-acetyltransferase [Planococcus halotolerans]|uniref:GNAT family N-acetyltransferase n=1 Tax=Planococcus halotolerans TaxID=2233542 RepID=UPI0013672BEA|nr:GNAT family N-acetyltransferase [Planococcus halotolerans]QHJ70437.1 GNAT family N-acetyltransferase [Planococcus halotolerans]
MVEIRRLSECTVEQGVEAWNKGFEGYHFDMTTTPEAFRKRMNQEGLSRELSVVAFDGEEPVGLVLNGIREFAGRKIGWNGGTGVAMSCRKKGVGMQLMEKTLEILKEQDVEVATLEAISGNEKAIALYRKLGYEIVDELHFMKLDGAVEEKVTDASRDYGIRKADPEEIGRLPFYRGDFPWQIQWQSVRDGGEGLIAFNEERQQTGYAFFRKLTDEEGKHSRTILYQCETASDEKAREEITNALLNRVFGNFADAISRTAVNVPVSANAVTYKVLQDRGFEKNISQVFMKKELKE